MSKKDKSNVIPLIKDANTRKIVKDQFDNPPGSRPTAGSLLDPVAAKQDNLKDKLARINQTMADLKNMVAKQNEYLTETGSALAPPSKPALDEEKLRAEYERKKDEAKKRRLENNRKVTREYSLHRPGSGPGRYDK
jgi:hypothetical protein